LSIFETEGDNRVPLTITQTPVGDGREQWLVDHGDAMFAKPGATVELALPVRRGVERAQIKRREDAEAARKAAIERRVRAELRGLGVAGPTSAVDPRSAPAGQGGHPHGLAPPAPGRP
jgi:hypothetical protein